MESSHGSSNESDMYGRDLLDSINVERIFCYNESIPNSAKKVFKTRDEKLDRSEVLLSHQHDPELLVYVPFLSPVKVLSFSIIGLGSGSSPLNVRVYKDRERLDLNSVVSLEPTQSFELLEDPTGEINYMTRVSRFSSTASLWLHFPTIRASDTLGITYIGLKGETIGLKKRQAMVGVHDSKPMTDDHRARDEYFGDYQVR